LAAAVICFGAGPRAMAQETQKSESAEPADNMKWKIANTLIFALGLGFLIAKTAPAFFNARSAEIQKAIKDATGLKIDADFRYSEADKRIAALSDEIKKLREQAALGMEREHERFQAAANKEIENVYRARDRELEAIEKDGVRQVRERSAQLALELAEYRLRERFRGGESAGLLDDFAHLVAGEKN
jgi:F0F1-type ATP synthase membrane subunit b/b'